MSEIEPSALADSLSACCAPGCGEDSARSDKLAGAFEKRRDDRHRLRGDCDDSLLEELLSFRERVDDEDEGMKPRILRRSEALRLRLFVTVAASVVVCSLREVVVSGMGVLRKRS
ncbi:hypothetical protein PHLGIDRAFT_25960 [Phlebiopsis gigantea 11061_1 CR5-6]|uniref:Uncharacterized protein n=1 Tax=Phlebiopsis gigantea (strain 11061_1 CR5-6) TaxID=745531 RepID=A0A0C3PE94_PHLG1|nr:hypothetical protein PHLGIDRAFT_25960 [Phlebiopsis gigantea 11061_1 CR5-6]